jgi:hypothetical protein
VLGDADEAIARVQDDVRRAEARAVRFGELREAVAAVRGRAVSRARDVAVEVDSTGAVTDLQISDQALHRGGIGLSAEIVALIAAAGRDARRSTADVAGGILGDDDPTVASLRAQLQEDDPETATGRPEGASWPAR